MKMLIIGLGSMGKRRAALLQSLNIAVAGVDSAPARRSQGAGLGLTVYESLDAALAAGGYSAAFVCTAPLSHAEITLKLLGAGLPVFSEINLVSDAYQEAMALAQKKALPLFLSSTMLYRAEIQEISARIAAFKQPVNYLYHVGQYLPNWHPWESYKDFFVGQPRTGGVREILGIELPWLLSCFGTAKAVHVESSSISGLALPYPDSLFITLRHESGARGLLAADVVCPKAQRSFEAFGEGLHLFWEGSPNSLYQYDTSKGEKTQIGTYDTYVQDPRYSDNIVENAYLDEIIDFLKYLKTGGKPRWGFRQDLEAIKLMNEIENFSGGGCGG